MSAHNPNTKPNDRGICYLVAETLNSPPAYIVIAVNLNKPKGNGVEGIVASNEFATADEADAFAARLTKQSLT